MLDEIFGSVGNYSCGVIKEISSRLWWHVCLIDQWAVGFFVSFAGGYLVLSILFSSDKDD
jgi:hypothetical protein